MNYSYKNIRHRLLLVAAISVIASISTVNASTPPDSLYGITSEGKLLLIDTQCPNNRCAATTKRTSIGSASRFTALFYVKPYFYAIYSNGNLVRFGLRQGDERYVGDTRKAILGIAQGRDGNVYVTYAPYAGADGKYFGRLDLSTGKVTVRGDLPPLICDEFCSSREFTALAYVTVPDARWPKGYDLVALNAGRGPDGTDRPLLGRVKASEVTAACQARYDQSSYSFRILNPTHACLAANPSSGDLYYTGADKSQSTLFRIDASYTLSRLGSLVEGSKTLQIAGLAFGSPPN